MVYKSVISSKSGAEVPLFLDGKPMHSKYSPSEERILSDSSVKEGFFLIGGIGAGYHIENLARQLDNYFILAFEADRESLEFCMGFAKVCDLAKNPRICFCQLSELQDLLAQRYIAALYGDFRCLFQRAWQKENEAVCARVETDLKATLKVISADFSVQSHFGKIWMHNILVNLRDIDGAQETELSSRNTEKCAAVIAAGPTLDSSTEILRERRDDFFIIATDTASGSLYRRGVEPDAIVCVDAQSVSVEHFYPLPQVSERTASPLVFLDLCAAPSIVRMLKDRGIRPIFFQSGHPLARLAAEQIPLMQVETGSGTVTIAAADIARQLGFSRIRLFGADFAYSRGKPYAGGTYLDARFNSWSSTLLSAEQQFSALMYRTPLTERKKGVFTSEVLESYAKSLGDWQEKHGYIKKLDELQNQNADKKRGGRSHVSVPPFDIKGFMKKCLYDIGQIDDIRAFYSSKACYALLPYMAFLRQHPADGEQSKGALELLKAASDFASSFAGGDI
jgi:hypothetical protein